MEYKVVLPEPEIDERDVLLAELTAQLMDTQDALGMVTMMMMDLLDFAGMAED